MRLHVHLGGAASLKQVQIHLGDCHPPTHNLPNKVPGSLVSIISVKDRDLLEK